MSPPTPFILPSRVYNPLALAKPSAPLLITSPTASELVTFAITYAQSFPAKGRHILITSQDRATITANLTSSLLGHASSFLDSPRAIIAADTITVYHVATLAQLRVLLSTLQHSTVDFLGVDTFIRLHEVAQELSAQGISRTLAAMVRITSSSAGILVLREPPESFNRVVPILNAGVSPGGAPSTATAPVLRILGRWVRGFWNQVTSDDDGQGSAEWVCRGERWRVQWTLVDGAAENVQISLLE